MPNLLVTYGKCSGWMKMIVLKTKRLENTMSNNA